MTKWLIIFILVLFYQEFLAQNNDIQIGSDPTLARRSLGAFYDLSEPNAVNIRVSIWGYVRYPGKYLVPDYTTVKDLISYAGGPQDGAQLEDIRLLKTLPDSSNIMLKFDYNDLLWGKELTTKYIKTPRLGVGDILLIPGSPRLSFRDYWQISLSIVSTLISVTLLVVNLRK